MQYGVRISTFHPSQHVDRFADLRLLETRILVKLAQLLPQLCHLGLNIFDRGVIPRHKSQLATTFQNLHREFFPLIRLGHARSLGSGHQENAALCLMFLSGKPSARPGDVSHPHM